MLITAFTIRQTVITLFEHRGDPYQLRLEGIRFQRRVAAVALPPHRRLLTIHTLLGNSQLLLGGLQARVGALILCWEAFSGNRVKRARQGDLLWKIKLGLMLSGFFAFMTEMKSQSQPWKVKRGNQRFNVNTLQYQKESLEGRCPWWLLLFKDFCHLGKQVINTFIFSC